MNKVKIYDSDGIRLTFDLINILNCLKDFGHRFHWAILDIYLTSKNNSNLNALELEKEVNSRDKLFSISFDDLLDLSCKFNQVIDGIFIASKSGIDNRIDRVELEEKCDIVIEAIDSSYWTVFSKDYQTIELLTNNFKKIEIFER